MKIQNTIFIFYFQIWKLSPYFFDSIQNMVSTQSRIFIFINFIFYYNLFIIYGFDGWGDWEGGYVMSALLHDIQAYVFSVLLGVRVDPVCTC